MQSGAPTRIPFAQRIFPIENGVARRCHALDWDTTQLGPVPAWPPALCALAGMVGSSALPMAVLWGAELAPVFNDAFDQLLGNAFPAGLGQPARRGWPEAGPFTLVQCERIIDTALPVRLEFERPGPQPAARWTLDLAPAFGSSATVQGIIVTATPSDGAASASEDRLRVALEAADLGTWDLDLTTDTAPVRSLRHDQIFGYETAQAEWGQEVAARHVLEQDRPAFEAAFADALQSGVLACEVRVRWPDGSVRWIAPRGRTYYDAQARPVRMAGVVADVTERNTAETLRRSEERFRLMADAVPQIVWITDAEGTVEFFNQQWRNYTGLDLAHQPVTAGDVAAQTLHPDDQAVTMERFDDARARGATYLVEHRIRAADGHYRWFLARGEPYRDTVTGAITRWFGASVDIHDRKLVEENLRRLTERQRFQIALADGIRPLADPEQVTAAASRLLGIELGVERVVYGEMDRSGERISLNKGWTAGALAPLDGVQLAVDDFGPAIGAHLRAGRVLAVPDVTSHAFTSGHSGAHLDLGIRAVLALPLMKNGVLRAVLNIHDTAVRHWNENDIAMAEDMVDRTWSAVESARAHAKLRIERDRSESLFAGMTEGFALFSPSWTVLEVNNAALRISQRERGDVLGKSHWEVWPEMIGTAGEAMYQRVMASREPETVEYYQPFSNGHAAWIEGRAYPAGKEDLAVFFRDISERKAAVHALKEADRRKDEFLAMLAHELRNPLAPIGAAAQLLQLARLSDERVRQTSQIIGRQVEHMTHLIDDLLDVSRVTRGLVQLDTARLDIGQIIIDAVEQVTPQLQARRHQLALELPPESTFIMGDKKRLVQVIANILNNAVKYTHEGGRIALTTTAHERQITISVVDSGIGMAPDLAAQAFDLFVQAERTSDRSAGGLGIGLALVKTLVELHGGHVACNSAGPGTGSTFVVNLPRLDTPHASDEAGQRAAAAPAVPLDIMIVDDNDDAAAMLALLLEASGHRVAVKHDAATALELARQSVPDVCLLDIGLPEIDGNELARRLRADPATAGAKLIAITGYGQESDRRQTAAAGFDHHLIKPVDTNQLASILSAIRGIKTG